jgi:hypothetical protein
MLFILDGNVGAGLARACPRPGGDEPLIRANFCFNVVSPTRPNGPAERSPGLRPKADALG